MAFPRASLAETFVRWSLPSMPSPQALGISTIVIPAAQPEAIRRALAQGYRVHVEVEAAAAATFVPPGGVSGVIVTGAVSREVRARLGQGMRVVRVAEARGKWPHIRTNWVTRNKDVLQVTNRSAQPWLENNAALARIASSGPGPIDEPVLFSYAWQPVTVADLDQGPRLENYLVAIAEAGSVGADLVLPLHDRFARALLAASPDARADWTEIRRALDFYAWNAAARHRRLADVGVVTADPMGSFEVLNLLARHNLAFDTIAPAGLAAHELTGLELVIVLDALAPAAAQRLQQFAAQGGTVLIAGPAALGAGGARPWRTGAAKTGNTRSSYAVGQGRVIEHADPPTDPNTFALEMRQILGADRRAVDIWNGITVLVTPYAPAEGGGLLLTAVNYAAQPLPLPVRVRGTFSEVQYEAPGHPAALLPFEHRGTSTEFVLPALHVGARIFLRP